MPLANPIQKLKKSYNIFSKTTLLHKVLYFLAFVVCISLITNYGRKQVEGFKEEGKKKTNDNVTMGISLWKKTSKMSQLKTVDTFHLAVSRFPL